MACLDFWPGVKFIAKSIEWLFARTQQDVSQQAQPGQIANILWALAVLDAPPGTHPLHVLHTHSCIYEYHHHGRHGKAA